MTEIMTRAPASRPWLGLGAVIASITTVSVMQSAVAPLLSLNLERQGVNSSWNGLLAASCSNTIASVSTAAGSIANVSLPLSSGDGVTGDRARANSARA